MTTTFTILSTENNTHKLKLQAQHQDIDGNWIDDFDQRIFEKGTHISDYVYTNRRFIVSEIEEEYIKSEE